MKLLEDKTEAELERTGVDWTETTKCLLALGELCICGKKSLFIDAPRCHLSTTATRKLLRDCAAPKALVLKHLVQALLAAPAYLEASKSSSLLVCASELYLRAVPQSCASELHLKVTVSCA